MKTYLDLHEAAEKYKLDPDQLRQMAEERKIRAGLYEGKLLLLEDDVAKHAANLRVNREQFTHLEGTPIRTADAARKYGVHSATITNWTKRGRVRIISQERGKTTVNEADVALESSRLKIKQRD